MAEESLVELTDDNFEDEVVKSQVPVLVDFWAEWCAPCLMVAPVVKQLAEEYQGRLKVGKLNTDNARQTAMRFGIMAIPTLLLFKDGEVAGKVVGVRSKMDLKSEIDKVLG